MKVHINDVFRSHYESIRNGSYKWTNEDIECIYELVNKFIDKYDVRIKNCSREDLVQELAMVFFREVRKYNIDNVHPLSVHLKRAFNRRCYCLENDSVSVDAISVEEIDEVDAIYEIEYETEIVKEQIINRFKEINKHNVIALEYFFGSKPMRKSQLAKTYCLSRERIAQLIVKSLRTARKDDKIRKLYMR